MKDFFSKLLNGMSIAIVCALIPNALLGEILILKEVLTFLNFKSEPSIETIDILLGHSFNLIKYECRINGKCKNQNYEEGDNDLYWLNCKNGNFYVIPEKELIEFVENLKQSDLEKISKFFNTLPKIKKDLDFSCKKCGYQETINLEGMQSFFA